MLQGACQEDTALFKPLVPKALNSEFQNLLFPLQIKRSKSQLTLISGFLFLAPTALAG